MEDESKRSHLPDPLLVQMVELYRADRPTIAKENWTIEQWAGRVEEKLTLDFTPTRGNVARVYKAAGDDKWPNLGGPRGGVKMADRVDALEDQVRGMQEEIKMLTNAVVNLAPWQPTTKPLEVGPATCEAT